MTTSQASPKHLLIYPGSFLPVTLEQLARETGVLRKDGITPCVQVSSRNHAALVRREESPCVLHILGAEVNSSSFVLYSTSLSVFFQTLVLISIGAIADYGEQGMMICYLVVLTSRRRLPKATASDIRSCRLNSLHAIYFHFPTDIFTGIASDHH